MTRSGALVCYAMLVLVLSGCQGLGDDLDQWPQQQGAGAAAPNDEVPGQADYVAGLQLALQGPAGQREAIAHYRGAAAQGHRGARYLLGMSYLVGQGVTADSRQALRWLEPLAASGHPSAQYHVGEIYMNGAGVPVERAWAVQWYERAARLGYPKAQFAVGVAYASGMGGVTDLRQGWFWLRLAAEAKQPHSEALLARLSGSLSPATRRQLDAEATGWRPDSAEAVPPRGLVRFVQYVLRLEGFEPGPVDGWWGPRSRAALHDYQRHHQLAGDGPNTATLEALRQRVRTGAI